MVAVIIGLVAVVIVLMLNLLERLDFARNANQKPDSSGTDALSLPGDETQSLTRESADDEDDDSGWPVNEDSERVIERSFHSDTYAYIVRWCPKKRQWVVTDEMTRVRHRDPWTVTRRYTPPLEVESSTSGTVDGVAPHHGDLPKVVPRAVQPKVSTTISAETKTAILAQLTARPVPNRVVDEPWNTSTPPISLFPHRTPGPSLLYRSSHGLLREN